MKTILQFLFVLASAGMAWAQTQIVVPGGLENVEGNSSSADLFIDGTARILQVYTADEFSSISAPLLRIDGLSFRLDEASGPVLGSWFVSIYLSTTSHTPDSLVPMYSDNHGDDGLLVLNGGSVGIVSRDTVPGPRPFRLDMRFATPFFYDPTKGNLAVEIGTQNFVGPSLLLDAQSAPEDAVGRVFGPIASIGNIDTLGLITRFDITPIPEPSILALSTFCMAFLFFGNWRKYHHGDR